MIWNVILEPGGSISLLPSDEAVPEGATLLVQTANPQYLEQLSPQRLQDEALASFVQAMEQKFDAVARERRYDNRITASLRAGYPGPFQAQGLAFATWMDTCNAMGYQLMEEVLTGQRPMPTVEEFLALLPPMVWPA